MRKAIAAAILVASAAGCVPSAPEPTPAPEPAPAPAPPPPPPPPVAALPAATYDNWLDAPQTPGDWRYTAEDPVTQATFVAGAGTPNARLTIICDLGTRRVGIARALEATGAPSGPAEMRIRTETIDRLLQAQPQPQPRARMQGTAPLAELAASDPLLDAMAFTKGRFAVETAGEQTLYVPAYPEISRVIEDCRRGSQ